MALVLIVAALLQDRYGLDPEASRFTAKVEVGGVLSMFGHDHLVALRDVSGDVRFDPRRPERSSLRLTIRAASIEEIGPEFSDEDRKQITREIHDKALEVARFPEIVFQSTDVSAVKKGDAEFEIALRGKLTMHGETRPVSVPVRLRLDGDRFSAEGSFRVRHSDYGIERLSAAAGLVKAKDEITLSFHLTGTK